MDKKSQKKDDCLVRTQMYIPDKLYSEAKQYAAQEGKPTSWVVRESLRKYLSTRVKKKVSFASFADKPLSYTGKRTNITTEHNEIYD
ncbi:MAG: hypothetical protein ACOCXT_04200 [Candidatus Dojkabacteria bacterium]